MGEDVPLRGAGGYKLNFDEIDENTNPFGLPTSSKPLAPKADPKTAPLGKIKPAVPKRTMSTHSNEDLPKPPSTGEFKPSELDTEIEKPLPHSSPVLSDPKNAINSTDGENSVSDDSVATPYTEEPQDETPQEHVEFNDEDGLSKKNSRRLSNSSAATFVLTSGTQSPVPADGDEELTPDDELVRLRAEILKERNLVADMKRCMDEYAISLQQLALEKKRSEEAAKESVIGIIAERDQAVEEISTIEKAFGDLHRRFEKSKQIIDGFKKNEEVLKKSAEDYQAQLRRQEQKYQDLKAHAEKNIIKFSEEMEQVKRNNETEITSMKTAIRRSELQIRSLESQLEQKTRENIELTKICDELISKYNDIN